MYNIGILLGGRRRGIFHHIHGIALSVQVHPPICGVAALKSVCYGADMTLYKYVFNVLHVMSRILEKLGLFAFKRRNGRNLSDVISTSFLADMHPHYPSKQQSANGARKRPITSIRSGSCLQWKCQLLWHRIATNCSRQVPVCA